MKKIIFCFLVTVVMSCGKQSEIHKQIANSDSLVINFNQQGSNIIDKTIITTERNAINELSEYIDAPAKTISLCPMAGNLMFYKKGVLVVDASFTYDNDSCREFVLKLGDRVLSTELSGKASEVLNHLKQGETFY